MFYRYFVSSFGTPLHHLKAAAAATLSPPFPRIVLLKLSLLSTATAGGNDRPTGYTEAENTCPMSHFLLNECGLCQSELSKILKRRPTLGRTRSILTAQQAVQFLRDSGLTEDKVRKIITRNESILTINVDRQLKPKIEFMKTLGLTAQDLANLISREPRWLTCSLEKTLRLNIQYIQNLFGSETIFKVLKSVPEILAKSNGPEYFENNLKHLASFGLPEDEIKEIVRRRPLLLNVSMEKVQKHMEFFTHTAGLPAKFLLTNPELLGYSLECRIKPRYKVLKSVSAMQPSQYLPSLTSFIYLPEGKFLEKYMKCSPHATKLLEVYSGKPVDRQLKPKIEFMKTLGLTAQDLANLISHESRLLTCSLEKTLRLNIQYIQNLFGSETNIFKVLKSVPQILAKSNGPEYFENKLKHLASFGLPEDEIKEIVRTKPLLLKVSMEKLQKHMDFFTHTAGLPAKYLLTNPQLLDYSLECRIKPRYKLFKFVSAMQPSQYLPSLTYAIHLTERKFLEKYVKCSPHASKLLEVYSGKPVDLHVIQ